MCRYRSMRAEPLFVVVMETNTTLHKMLCQIQKRKWCFRGRRNSRYASQILKNKKTANSQASVNVPVLRHPPPPPPPCPPPGRPPPGWGRTPGSTGGRGGRGAGRRGSRGPPASGGSPSPGTLAGSGLTRLNKDDRGRKERVLFSERKIIRVRVDLILSFNHEKQKKLLFKLPPSYKLSNDFITAALLVNFIVSLSVRVTVDEF